MVVPADEGGQALEQTHQPESLSGLQHTGSGGIERVCSSIRPAEAEAIHISEHELKSQEPMCSVELRKIP